VRELLGRRVADLDAMRRELRRILNSWHASSQRLGVIGQHIEGEGVTCMERVSLCPSCDHCPAVVLDGDTVRIGEDENVVALEKAEWNVLVDAIKSGRLGRV
jgi:hypothetical protein